MSLTIASYKTKLTTHATTAGAGFMYDWFDAVNSKLRDNTLESPFIVVEPTKWKLNPLDSFSISFKCTGYIDETTTRAAAYDSLNVILNKFLTAINTDASLQVADSNIDTDLMDFGNVVENLYVISFETTITIWC